MSFLMPKPSCKTTVVVLFKPWPRDYLSMTPTRQDLTQGLFYTEDLGEEEVGHKPRLVRCWSMLVTGSQGAI